MPSIGGLTSAVSQAIDGLAAAVEMGLEEAAVQHVIDVLTDSVSALQEHPLPEVDAGSFGGSGSAANFGFHTGVAQQHVLEATMQMVQGLNGYKENVQTYRTDVQRVNDDTTVAMGDLDSASACITPNYQTNQTCTPAGSED